MSDHARVQRYFGSMLVASDDAGGIAEVGEAAAYKRRASTAKRAVEFLYPVVSAQLSAVLVTCTDDWESEGKCT